MSDDLFDFAKRGLAAQQAADAALGAARRETGIARAEGKAGHEWLDAAVAMFDRYTPTG